MDAETANKPDDEVTTTQEGGPSRVKKISVALFDRRRPTEQEIKENGGALLGKMMGEITGFVLQKSIDAKNGMETVSEVLRGEFYAERNDETKSVVQAGSLYLPSGFHEDALDHIAPIDAKTGERVRNGKVVRFVYEIWSIPRDKSAYAFELRPIVEQKSGEKPNILHLLKNAENVARQKIEAAKQIQHDAPKGKAK